MPFNITSAVTQTKGFTLMPTYGLNVYSMLKHTTVVMTLRSIDTIESKLLYIMNNCQFRESGFGKNAK